MGEWRRLTTACWTKISVGTIDSPKDRIYEIQATCPRVGPLVEEYHGGGILGQLNVSIGVPSLDGVSKRT